MSSNCDNKKYIVTETREPTENEFIFTSHLFGDRSENKRLWDYLETNYGIAREKIPSYQLPTDSSNNRMSGFRIIKSDKEDGYEPYNDW